MKKILLLLILSAILPTISIAQKAKISIENDTVYVNGKPEFILDMVSAANFDFKLKTLDGAQVAFLQFNDFFDSKEISSGNPKGRVTYFEFTFLESGLKCETSIPGMKKAIAKFIHENGLIQNNQLNEKAVKDFVLIQGTKYSEQKRNSTTIIIVR